MRRFLNEQSADDVLRAQIKSEIEGALEGLAADASESNVIQVVNDVLEKIALETQIPTQRIRILYRDMILNNEIESLSADLTDDESEEDEQLEPLKSKLTTEDFQSLKKALKETKTRIKIKNKLKENEDTETDNALPISVSNHIQEIINELVANHPDEEVNSYFGELTAKLMDPADPILTQYNKREVANVVDSYLEKLGLTANEKPEDAGQIKGGAKVGEIGSKNYYDDDKPVTDITTSEKKLTESFNNHMKLMHHYYKKSASRFLE
jgi:hypothetical protein